MIPKPYGQRIVRMWYGRAVIILAPHTESLTIVMYLSGDDKRGFIVSNNALTMPREPDEFMTHLPPKSHRSQGYGGNRHVRTQTKYVQVG